MNWLGHSGYEPPLCGKIKLLSFGRMMSELTQQAGTGGRKGVLGDTMLPEERAETGVGPDKVRRSAGRKVSIPGERR